MRVRSGAAIDGWGPVARGAGVERRFADGARKVVTQGGREGDHDWEVAGDPHCRGHRPPHACAPCEAPRRRDRRWRRVGLQVWRVAKECPSRRLKCCRDCSPASVERGEGGWEREKEERGQRFSPTVELDRAARRR
jgi:hypothetical protein